MSTPETAFNMLADIIKPLLPSTWRFVGYEDSIDDPDATTVVLKLHKVERHPGAPMGAYLTTWIVTVIDPHADPALADPALFDAVIDLCDDLNHVASINWQDAVKVTASDRLAYDITLTAQSTRPGISMVPSTPEEG